MTAQMTVSDDTPAYAVYFPDSCEKPRRCPNGVPPFSREFGGVSREDAGGVGY